jgi:hypothetical protein
MASQHEKKIRYLAYATSYVNVPMFNVKLDKFNILFKKYHNIL